jgi:hypothetical protein
MWLDTSIALNHCGFHIYEGGAQPTVETAPKQSENWGYFTGN